MLQAKFQKIVDKPTNHQVAYYSKSRYFYKSSEPRVTRFPEQRVKAAKPISEGTPRGRMREADKTEMQRAETPSRNLPDERHTESMHGADSAIQRTSVRLAIRYEKVCEWDSAGGIFFRLMYSMVGKLLAYCRTNLR